MSETEERMGRRRVRGGFTLIELMLVLTIMGILTAITVPSVAKSIRGNRLRAATRAVVSSGKYARSMAVLRQIDVELTFDMGAGTIRVGAAQRRRSPEPEEEAAEDVAAPDPYRLPDEDKQPVFTTGSAGAAGLALSRRLDRVRIESVDAGEDSARSDGSCSVRYSRNGRCMAYSVKLVDERGEWVLVKVDEFAGVKTERDWRY